MLNKVALIGRLGNNPEEIASGTGANFSLATNRKYKKKDGEQVEETQWHRITTWGKLAELCMQYLHKGSLAYIEGRLEYNIVGEGDEQRTYTKIVANEVRFLPSGDAKPAEDVEF